jgi:hypothetical protein
MRIVANGRVEAVCKAGQLGYCVRLVAFASGVEYLVIVMKFLRFPPRWLSTYLVVWMTVVSFAICIHHTHRTIPVENADLIRFPQVPEPSESHRHLILLGVELPAEMIPECHPACSAEPLLTDSCLLQDGEAPSGHEELATTEYGLWLTVDGTPVRSRSCSAHLTSTLCLSHFACRAVTGVLRI